MSKSFMAGEALYRAFRGQRRVLVDVQALEHSILSGEAGSALYRLMSESADYSTDGKAIALYQRALAGWVLQGGSGGEEEAVVAPLPISLQPPTDSALRRAGRLLAMVHELHKAGYQRLRISAGMSPTGIHWRCHITSADNVQLDGWDLVQWGEEVVTYSSADDHYFGWQDSAGKSARQLAQLFIERFPELARKGVGQDRAYAGWFVSMLGNAENGRFPVFFADYPLSPTEEEMPPPPCGYRQAWSAVDGRIANADLRLEHLPPPEARWDELEAFCLTYDGYAGGQKSIGQCMAQAAQVASSRLAEASLDDLRTTLFMHQRDIRNNHPMPPSDDDLRLMHAIVEQIRSRLSRG